ncbi:hypothetical protein CCHR01_16654 [Colletotrichum chrysophilum]|uniref:Uncharacterized protein n=1 Tax=Colletotrichum chrysophilum TaxID=1836956 RepID=A0AAD9A3E9_9PEZI|nr:hypothetical protein CCHR01_16654 [Colletotrichum chrysophilum]
MNTTNYVLRIQRLTSLAHRPQSHIPFHDPSKPNTYHRPRTRQLAVRSSSSTPVSSIARPPNTYLTLPYLWRAVFLAFVPGHLFTSPTPAQWNRLSHRPQGEDGREHPVMAKSRWTTDYLPARSMARNGADGDSDCNNGDCNRNCNPSP